MPPRLDFVVTRSANYLNGNVHASQFASKKKRVQGNCIKLGQTHVRLPESGRGAPCGRPSQAITPRTVQIVVRYREFSTSLATGGRFPGRKKKTIGRGAPCGRPSQGKTPRTVQIVVRYRKFHTSLATGGRFLGRKKKTIGRGAPCGRPSQGKTPRTVQIVVRYRKFQTSLATGGRFLGRKKKTIGRGAPCGRPSSAILASELRCVCPVPKWGLLDISVRPRQTVFNIALMFCSQIRMSR